MAGTGILRVRVASASAKVRRGGPVDERRDVRDEGVVGRVWSGVVPVWEEWGGPRPCGGGRVEGVPGYIEREVEGGNRRRREAAEEAAGV